jgi:hypothetical protein
VKQLLLVAAEAKLIAALRSTAAKAADQADLDLGQLMTGLCATIAQCLTDVYERPGSWEAEIGRTFLRDADPDLEDLL